MTTADPVATAPAKKPRARAEHRFDVTVPQTQLAEALSAVLPAVDKKSAMPALSAVLLTARDQTLHVEATDLYLAIGAEAVAEIAAPGAVVVHASDLAERIKAMPLGPLRITADAESRVTVKAIGAERRFELAGMPGTDFPTIPTPGSGARAMHVRAGLLLDLIARTQYAISSDLTRPHVNSALLVDGDKVVTMAATDGHRLSVAKAPADMASVDRLPPLLIQQKAVGAIRKLIEAGGADGDIPIRHDGVWAFVEASGCRLATKLVDAQFPPYEAVIPKRLRHAVSIERVLLLDALRAVAVAGKDGVKMALGDGRLRIRAEDAGGGVGFDEIGVDYGGPPADGGFNPRYLVDALAALDCESVELEFAGGVEPLVIRPAGQAESFVGVVMPMRI